jgi:ElaB/YqjD/DUF883 family membrane-anchored ribosome-binding protein
MNMLDKDHESIDRGAARGHEAVDKGAGAARQASDKLRGQAKHAEQKMEEALADVQEHSQELAEGVTQFIKDNPMLSIGMAVAAGALLNTILRSR